MQSKSAKSPTTVGNLVMATVTILTGMAAMGAAVSYFLVPMILNNARSVAREEVVNHERVEAHYGSLPRREFERVLGLIDGRLSRIERKLDQIKE